MGSVMDQERPWGRENMPEAETMRKRIEDAYTRRGGKLEPVMQQIIKELERIEALALPAAPVKQEGGQ